MPGSGAFRNKLIVDHQNAGNLADIIGNGKQTVPGGGGVDQATKDQNKILDETRKSASLTAKGMMNQPKWWTKALKTMGVQMGISGILKQSQIFTSTLGSLFQILGAFVDVILAPWIPVIIPALRKLALQIPRMRKLAQEFKDWVVDDAWPWLQEKWKSLRSTIFSSTWLEALIPRMVLGLKDLWDKLMNSALTSDKTPDWLKDIARGLKFNAPSIIDDRTGQPFKRFGHTPTTPVSPFGQTVTSRPVSTTGTEPLNMGPGGADGGGGLSGQTAGNLIVGGLASLFATHKVLKFIGRHGLASPQGLVNAYGRVTDYMNRGLGRTGGMRSPGPRGVGPRAAQTIGGRAAQTAAGPAARTGMMVGARAFLTGGLAAGVGTAMFSTAMLASVPLIIFGMKPLANKAIDKLIPKSKFKSELQNVSGTMDELKRTTDVWKIVNAMTAQKKKLKALHPNLSDVERLAMMRENLGITGGLGTNQKLSMPAHLLTSRPMMNKQQIEQMGANWKPLPLRQHKWKQNKKGEWEKWGFEDRLHASRWANRGLMSSDNFRESSTGSRSFDPSNRPFTSSGIPNLDPNLGTETYRKQAAKDNIVDPLVEGFQKVMDNVTLSLNVSGLGDLPPKNGSVSAEAYTA